MITTLLLLAILFATIAVTIAAGSAVLAIRLWLQKLRVLRGFQVLNNAYQSLAVENAYLRNLIVEPRERAQMADNTEPLFVPHWSKTLH